MQSETEKNIQASQCHQRAATEGDVQDWSGHLKMETYL